MITDPTFDEIRQLETELFPLLIHFIGERDVHPAAGMVVLARALGRLLHEAIAESQREDSTNKIVAVIRQMAKGESARPTRVQ
jgi:hypothetical protein